MMNGQEYLNMQLCQIYSLQVMEVLQALVLKANLDAGTAEPSPVLAQVLGNIPDIAGLN